LFYKLVVFFFSFVLINAGEVIYKKPIQGEQNKDWIITNYVDTDKTKGSFRDYKNGFITYDGHRGIDLSIKDFDHMDEGVDIYAARDGKITFIRDGLYDKETKWSKTHKKGNWVKIKHKDGSVASYGHFKKNSIKKLNLEVGDFVKAGQKIGEVGSSGHSTGPHLHFALFDKNGNFIDMMRSKKHKFDFDISYGKTSVIDLGVTTKLDAKTKFWHHRPDSQKCIKSVKQDRIYFWTKLSHVDEGSYVHFEIKGPTKKSTKLYKVKKNRKMYSFYWYYNDIKLKDGNYTVEVVYNDEILNSYEFNAQTSCQK
jgi:murein DD-endopeptidase MepM/ murein hydrolase activator NlpD